jgi:hypothetical protein
MLQTSDSLILREISRMHSSLLHGTIITTERNPKIQVSAFIKIITFSLKNDSVVTQRD